MFNVIVVGTDGSSTAQAAVDKATEMAKLSGATLHVVTGYRVTSPALAGPEMLAGISATANFADDQANTARQVVERAAAKAAAEGVEVEAHAAVGEAAEVLIDVATAQSADVIVVGNRGMTGAKRFLLGSVPNRVAHHAPCSVLVVRTA
jgi:nucleotide-binding universal stress UspA family protein